MEQVPIPQLTEHSKPFQQLLSKTSEKTIIQNFVQQSLSEGQSINKINKEFGIPYNLVYEIAHGTKRPGGSQYKRKKTETLTTPKKKKT